MGDFVYQDSFSFTRFAGYLDAKANFCHFAPIFSRL
jgi:hypothetical protein